MSTDDPLVDDESISFTPDMDAVASDEDDEDDEKTPSRAWSYDIWNLKIDGDPELRLLDGQLTLAHNYQCDLVRLELDRRKRYRALRRGYFPELAEIEAAIEVFEIEQGEIRSEGKGVRSKKRRRVKFSAEAKKRLNELSRLIKPLRERKKAVIAGLEGQHRDFLTMHCPDAIPLEDEIKRCTAEIKRLSPKKKKKEPGEAKRRKRSKREKDVISDLKDRRDIAKAERRELLLGTGEKSKLFLFFMLEMDADALREENKQRANEIRAKSGVFWGSYLLVNKTVKDIRGKKVDPVDPDSPEGKRWHGEGRVGIVFQPPIPLQRIFGQKNQLLQITAPSEDTYYMPRRCDRRKKSQTSGRLRLDSTATHKPIWLSFDFNMHRPIPDDAIVKMAWIKRTRVGWERRYKLQVVVSSEKFSKETSGTGTCGIDLGWRCKNGRPLRVAYLVDDQGHEEEICLDPAIQEKFDHVSSLRSIRDLNFDKIREEVIEWLDGHTARTWLHQHWKFLAKCKSVRKFAKDIEVWAQERVEGDEEIFPKVWDYYLEENHLYFWEANEREKILACRLDDYRNASARIASRYEGIRLEDFNLAKVAKLSLPEADQEVPQKMRHNRVQAAPSEFRSALISACTARGTLIEKNPCEYTTMICHICGHENEWDKAAQVMHTCENCKATWDQDQNAAINVLLFQDGKKGGYDAKSRAAYALKEESTCEVGLYFDPTQKASSPLRAGYVKDKQGRREISITPNISRLLDDADRIHRDRQNSFTAIREKLDSALAHDLKGYLGKMWLSSAIPWAIEDRVLSGRTHAPSPRRLVRVVSEWKTRRVQWDGEIFELTRDWMTQEEMAREKEIALRKEASRIRRAIFEEEAQKLTGYKRVTILAIGAGGIPRRLDTAPSDLRNAIEEVLKKHRIPYNTDRRRHYESARARLGQAIASVA
jgi:hypothetical protein